MEMGGAANEWLPDLAGATPNRGADSGQSSSTTQYSHGP